MRALAAIVAWLRPAVFASALWTDVEDSALRKDYANVGTQLDLRFSRDFKFGAEYSDNEIYNYFLQDSWGNYSFYVPRNPVTGVADGTCVG